MGKDKIRILKVIRYSKKPVTESRLKSKFKIKDLDKVLQNQFKEGGLKISKEDSDFELSSDDFKNDSDKNMFYLFKNMKGCILKLTEGKIQEVDSTFTVYFKDNKISRGDRHLKINPPEKRVKMIDFTLEELYEEMEKISDDQKNMKKSSFIGNQLELFKGWIKASKEREIKGYPCMAALLADTFVKKGKEEFINELCTNVNGCNGTFGIPYRIALLNIFIRKNVDHAFDIFLDRFNLKGWDGRCKFEDLIIWHLFGNVNYKSGYIYACFSVYYDKSFKDWLRDNVGNMNQGFKCDVNFEY